MDKLVVAIRKAYFYKLFIRAGQKDKTKQQQQQQQKTRNLRNIKAPSKQHQLTYK